MYMVFFALASAIGGWVAWRNNPMYSNRGTLRFIAIVGCAVAAVIGGIIGVVNLVSTASEGVAIATILTATLVGTIALISVIIAVCTPRPPPVPAGTKLLTVHRARLVPWGWRALAALAVFGLLALVLPEAGRDMALILAAFTLYLGILMLTTGYIAALGLDRSLTSMETSSWVHWTYTPEQWKAWIEVEVSRVEAKPNIWSWRAHAKNLTIVFVAIAVCMFAFNPGPWLFDAGYTVVMAGMLIGIVALANGSQKTVGTRTRRMLAKASPETYFGEAGVLVDGTYVEWLTTADYLVEATIDERVPKCISLLFIKIVAGTAPNAVEARYNVLIPDGADADIARLQTAISRVCPKARVALT